MRDLFPSRVKVQKRFGNPVAQQEAKRIKRRYLRQALVPFMETTVFVLFSRSMRASHAPGISLCDGGLSLACAQPPSLVTTGFTLQALHLRSRTRAVRAPHCACIIAPSSFVLFSKWHLAVTNVVQLTPCPSYVCHVRRVLPRAPISTIRGTMSFDAVLIVWE